MSNVINLAAAPVTRSMSTLAKRQNSESFINSDIHHAMNGAAGQSKTECAVITARIIDVDFVEDTLVSLGYYVEVIKPFKTDNLCAAGTIGTIFKISWDESSSAIQKEAAK